MNALGRSTPTNRRPSCRCTQTSTSSRWPSSVTPLSDTTSTRARFLPTSPTAIQMGVVLRRGRRLEAPLRNPHPSTSPRQGHTPHPRRPIHETQHPEARPDRRQDRSIPRRRQDRPQALRRALEPLLGFGAVPDIWVEDSGVHGRLQRRILFFHPSTRIFKDTVSKSETTDSGLKDMEQPYLNRYCGAESVLLPYAYGGSLANKGRSPEMWKAMRLDMRISVIPSSSPLTSKRSARSVWATKHWRKTSRNGKVDSKKPK